MECKANFIPNVRSLASNGELIPSKRFYAGYICRMGQSFIIMVIAIKLKNHRKREAEAKRVLKCAKRK